MLAQTETKAALGTCAFPPTEKDGALSSGKKKKPCGLSYPKVLDTMATGIDHYPFLLEQDLHDIKNFKHLNMMQIPRWESINKTTEAWSKLANMLSGPSMTDESGNKLYPHGMS